MYCYIETLLAVRICTS